VYSSLASGATGSALDLILNSYSTDSGLTWAPTPFYVGFEHRERR